MNEIVLSEETDEVEPGKYFSHFDLYIVAMDEVGANTKPVKEFVRQLSAGKAPNEILDVIDIPKFTKEFVMTTLDISKYAPHQSASAFLFGREEIIPKMFRNLLEQLEGTDDLKCPYFRLYLQRHIHLDETRHAPMGRKLLENLCEGNPQKWKEAYEMAYRAIDARHALWDGVLLLS